MNNRSGIGLRRFWCVISVCSLFVPFFLAPYEHTPMMFNMMTSVLVTMFALSCPFSLFTLPLFALFKTVLELEPDSIFGAYFYLILINVIGYIQWFWLMPRILGRSKPFNLPSILNN